MQRSRSITFGRTDDFGYNIVENPVHVHALHATILHCLGINHTRLIYKFQGRHYRLTDVHGQSRHADSGVRDGDGIQGGKERRWFRRRRYHPASF